VPEYPKWSLAEGHNGLALAVVDFDERGNAVRVSVLQAPDVAIARKVRACAASWEISPSKSGERIVRRGKLYFYFVQSLGRGEVFLANNPNQRERLRYLVESD